MMGPESTRLLAAAPELGGGGGVVCRGRGVLLTALSGSSRMGWDMESSRDQTNYLNYIFLPPFFSFHSFPYTLPHSPSNS